MNKTLAALKATLITIGCLWAIVLAVLLIPSVWCRPFDLAAAKADDAARRWIHLWPGEFDWDVEVEESRWKVVVASKISDAESALARVASVPLTDSQALEFTGAPRPENVSGKPYLLRAVEAATGRPRVELHARSRNTDLWIGSGAISHCPVPTRKQPVVAWLDQPPHEVFVSFGVAE
jgi:hypothetical protein